ncbi:MULTISPECIES: family 78 glycoside hydrolase catalytic domain [Bacillota]|uniref:Family 78 glycoside hydrolase catalytic domain n=2 Tax=Amedibacillus TaxID=2749846 RepID=A0A7G9GK35_9FIRM|nr:MULTISPECIES: family 78 glycoside hydrolase catalytic domain [Bacillota]QNM11167.1 family 78 glycoside hydrolase catalytic domain [[Eubacterium] hominis]MCH4284782.1 family 78 glycoside hydrolase catalytic domain [Amedibacillus hominis]RGB52614.1 alpha-rhamnosidase [Absiella sp. AM22-9]RGB57087.1 alpha-rhamnosidase [Absiella sp. AM10-20]RGB68062.1 alpha-rhamnosidase [Absiella sp. AM09-45]
MAFTFQINQDVVFQHDKKLIDQADQYRPEIYHQTILPRHVAELVEDDTKLGGYRCKESSLTIAELNKKGLKRDDTIILDFDDHYVGNFSMKIEATGSPMDAPLYFRIRFAEVPSELVQDSKDYDGWLSKSWIQEEFIHIDVLPTEITLPRRYSFRYVEIKVIDTSPKWQAVFSEFKVVARSSAQCQQLKPIHIEDPVLQKIYDVSVKTLQDCMQDVFEDGPKRDRRLWLGDLRLQALANYMTFDQHTLVKRCLYLFAAMTTQEGKISANLFIQPEYMPDDTFLFDYSLFFISTLYDYIKHHDDSELLQDLYPIAKKQMMLAQEKVNEEGRIILEESYPVFVDWSNEFNKDTSAQAIMIYVTRQMIELASMYQDEDITIYQTLLDNMINYSRDNLFDKEACLFISGDNKEYNISSQAWMVLANVLTKEENKKVMQKTIQKLFPVKGIATPYMYHHIVEALFVAGLQEEAIQLMKAYWGKMISLGADTFWEAFDPDEPDYSPYGNPIMSSFCHAWSCTPAYLIRKYIENR